MGLFKDTQVMQLETELSSPPQLLLVLTHNMASQAVFPRRC